MTGRDCVCVGAVGGEKGWSGREGRRGFHAPSGADFCGGRRGGMGGRVGEGWRCVMQLFREVGEGIKG